MKQEDYEKLGKLGRMIYDYLEQAFMDGDYQFNVTGKGFDMNGYVDAVVVFGGYTIRCAINNGRKINGGGYICWFIDDQLKTLLEGVPDLVETLISETKEILKKTEIEYKKKRIKELQAELEELKK